MLFCTKRYDGARCWHRSVEDATNLLHRTLVPHAGALHRAASAAWHQGAGGRAVGSLLSLHAAFRSRVLARSGDRRGRSSISTSATSSADAPETRTTTTSTGAPATQRSRQRCRISQRHRTPRTRRGTNSASPLMCSEEDPAHCHRRLLIGRVLDRARQHNCCISAATASCRPSSRSPQPPVKPLVDAQPALFRRNGRGQMEIYSIGFTQKSPAQFFGALKTTASPPAGRAAE